MWLPANVVSSSKKQRRHAAHLHEVEHEPGGHALPHDVDAEVGQRLQQKNTDWIGNHMIYTATEGESHVAG